MRIAALALTQRDGGTCGPSVAVVAGALLDRDYDSKLDRAHGRAWFDAEQGRVHAATNRVWPSASASRRAAWPRTISGHSVARDTALRWRPWRGRRTRWPTSRRAVHARWPVAMLIGNAIPRHWVLIVECVGETLHCYEPSSGELVPVSKAAVRTARLTPLGYPRAFALVLPRCRLGHSRNRTYDRTVGELQSHRPSRPADAPLRLRRPRSAAGGPAPAPTGLRRTRPAAARRPAHPRSRRCSAVSVLSDRVEADQQRRADPMDAGCGSADSASALPGAIGARRAQRIHFSFELMFETNSAGAPTRAIRWRAWPASYATADVVALPELLDFVRPRHRMVLTTFRSDGSLQSSPVTGGVDDAGRIVVASYPQRAKSANIRRDPAPA